MESSRPKLYPYQERGIEWLRSKHRAILGDDCGLGKTAQSLISSNFNSILVICPASVKINWANEVRIWTDLTPIVCRGSSSFIWPSHNEVVICNPEIIPDFIHEPSCPIHIIIDEAHVFRNNRPQKYRNTKYIIHRAGYHSSVVAMSGTPIVNRISDLFNVIDLIDLTGHFGGKEGFAKLLNTKFGKRGDIRNPVISESFTTLLSQVCLRRMKQDVMDDLPEKIYSVHRIDEWSGELETIMNAGLSSLEAYEKINGPISNGTLPALTELAKARHDMAVAKIPHTEPLVDSILECGEQVVVFSAHKKPVTHFGLRDNWGIIDGSVSVTRRQKASDSLRDDKIQGLAATIGAGNCGLNLQSCFNTIFIDLSYQLSENKQCEDRTCRIGQKNNFVRYNYITLDHALDRRLGAICSGKEKLFQSVLNPITVRE